MAQTFDFRLSTSLLIQYTCGDYMARVTLPALMQLVHTRILLGVPFTEARTVCKLGSHLRLVLGARRAHAPE